MRSDGEAREVIKKGKRERGDGGERRERRKESERGEMDIKRTSRDEAH